LLNAFIVCGVTLADLAKAAELNKAKLSFNKALNKAVN
jgi:hypothetical protein